MDDFCAGDASEEKSSESSHSSERVIELLSGTIVQDEADIPADKEPSGESIGSVDSDNDEEEDGEDESGEDDSDEDEHEDSLSDFVVSDGSGESGEDYEPSLSASFSEEESSSSSSAHLPPIKRKLHRRGVIIARPVRAKQTE